MTSRLGQWWPEVGSWAAAGLRIPAYSMRILDDFELAGIGRWDDSGVVIRGRFRVAPLEQWSVRREYLKRLKAEFDRRRIEIPYPHRKILLQQEPESRENGPGLAKAAHAGDGGRRGCLTPAR